MHRIVLYDGMCGLCRAVVAFITKRDPESRFRMVALQSDEGQMLISKTGLPEKDTNTVIYFTDEKFVIRSTAVLNILRDLGGFWKMFYVFIIVPVPVRDSVYKFIARNRHRWFG